jgi:CHASE2 domain-containing sensor protein
VSNTLKVGDIVERYRVESLLGEGGTARVYRVRHTTLETVHALKVLTLDHPEIRGRLIVEGKAQAKLSHPNIVPVRDVLDHGGVPALLMDFVPGPSLADRIAEGIPHPDEVTRLFGHIVEGVAYAHSLDLVHRDLKPANVLLDVSKTPAVPRVTDFGLVRLLHLPEGETRRTAVGVTMGTLGFMAPEQLTDAHAVDVRTDVFALGALLYTMLVGRSPFSGDDQLAVMNATAEGRYTPLDDAVGDQLGRGLSAVVAKALQVNPDDRFQTADEMRAALETRAAPADAGQTMSWAITTPSPPAKPVGKAPVPESLSLGPDQRVAVVPALIVDQAGLGHQVSLSVVIDTGGEGVMHPPNVGRSAEVAAQLAVRVALGAKAETCGVRWAVRGVSHDIQGTSLGLALSMAVWCADQGHVLPEGIALTGGMDLDGRVAPVSGVPAKLRAAAASGSEIVYVPAEGLGQLESPQGVTIIPVRRFEEVLARLFGPSPSQRTLAWWRPRFLALLIPVFAALTSLSTRIEPLFYDPMLVAIHGALPADNTAIVAFAPQRDARALRPRHPSMIDALVAAGAKAIFFDVILGAETPHDDAIAQAITRASAAGVPVILPLMSENQSVLFPASSALRDSAWFGVVLAQTDTTFWHVRRAPMRIRELNGNEHWHAAAQTVRAHLGVEDLPHIEDGELIIGPNRNPVWADLAYLHPAEASPVLAYDPEGDFTAVRGRSVLIGELGGADDVHRTGSGTVYGVEIEAMMVETLLQQRAPQLASPETNALWAFIVGVFTALLGLAVPRTRRRIALAVPVVGMGVGIILVGAGLLVAFGPMLLASFIGLWIVRAQKSETMGRSHP